MPDLITGEMSLPPVLFGAPANPGIYAPLAAGALAPPAPPPPGVTYAATGFNGGNVLDGPLAAVLSAIGGQGTGGPAMAVLTTTDFTDAYPGLPSVITEAVWIA